MAKHSLHEQIAGDHTTSLRVFGIRLPDGTCPLVDWLEGLTNRQYAGIMSRFNTFAAQGFLRTPDSFNQLAAADPAKGHPRVDEVKHMSENLRAYVVGFSAGHSVAYVTHGSTKAKPKKLAVEIARARKIYEEGQS